MSAAFPDGIVVTTGKTLKARLLAGDGALVAGATQRVAGQDEGR